MSPFHITGWKCFVENWACTTFPQEIDWDSASIGHECGVVVSLGVGGVAFVMVWGVCVGSISPGRARGPWVVSGIGGVAFVGFLCFSGQGAFCFVVQKEKGKKNYVNLTINSLTKSLRRVMNMTHDRSSGLHLF